jgi:hypothetical protein
VRRATKPLAAGRLGGAALETIPFALRIGVGRVGLVQQLAEVVEMRLCRRPLLEIGRLPLGYELLGGSWWSRADSTVRSRHRAGPHQAMVEKATQAPTAERAS